MRTGHWNDARATYALRDSDDITSPSVSGNAPTAFRRTAGTDARLVGGGVAPGQSPSQLTPLGVVTCIIERGARTVAVFRTEHGVGKGLITGSAVYLYYCISNHKCNCTAQLRRCHSTQPQGMHKLYIQKRSRVITQLIKYTVCVGDCR